MNFKTCSFVIFLNEQLKVTYSRIIFLFFSAMHCAASRGHLDCIDILSKSCSADVDCCDKNGCTPLFYAITLGHAKCAEFLLDMGSDPNHQDKKGRTPSHCAAAKGSKECAELLKKRKADMWIRNSRGEYPMHEAAQASQKGTASLDLFTVYSTYQL